MPLQPYADDRAALEAGTTTCAALVEAFLREIQARNGTLNAFVRVDAEGARARAALLDDDLAAGRPLPPLGGMVVAVKDNICIEGQPVTCASRILDGFTSQYDATVIERLQAAGAIFIGHTNCDEFGMGSSNENSYYGPVQHPQHPDYVPGGSSGGSAAAVAAGLCHVALGSDTGGSVRQPAAFCGVVGLKPTYGRVSRSGLVAYASSFDCIGTLARSVADAAAVLQEIAGVDAADATSAPVAVPDYRAALGGSAEGLRIGVPQAFLGTGLDPAIRAMVEAQAERLRAAGATLVDVDLPHAQYGIATYYILATAEASSNLARYDGIRYGYRADLQPEAARAEASLLDRLYTQTRSEGFGDEVKRRILLGTYVLSAGYYEAYYARAQRVRTLIRRDFEAAFAQADLLLTPATPTPPFRQGTHTADPLAMYLNDLYTVTANLAGIPGLVVPLGAHPEPPHLPVGLQLLAAPFAEATLLRAGEVVMKPAPPPVQV